MYIPNKYWNDLALSFSYDDPDSLAPVLHPGAPYWFNLLVDRLQMRAWRKALRHCELGELSLVLDVGCGTGRWLRRFSLSGVSAVGLDGSAAMLKSAKVHNTPGLLALGQLQNLPFSDNSFDLVSSITVVQHIPYGEQEQTLNELVRVLRPSGYLLLLELTSGKTGVTPHVFSHSADQWIRTVCSIGCDLVYQSGQEFFVIDRIFAGVVGKLRALLQGQHPEWPFLNSPSGHHKGQFSITRKMYWGLRRVSAMLSTPIEPVAEVLCPPQWATHGVFIFTKKQ